MPFCAANRDEYARFVEPFGTVVDVIVSAGLIVMLSGCVYVCGVVSVSLAVMEKLKVPLAEGGPVMAQVLALRERPVGKAPALTEYEFVPFPPDAAQEAE